MLTEFWGIEVKAGQTIKCEAGDRSFVHLSQASLGVTKKEKGAENVPIFVKIDDQKLVIGTLSIDKCAQIHYDIVFDKEFELSHGSKNASVFFIGYKRVNFSDESEDGFDDSSSADGYEIVEKAHGKPSKNKQGKSTAEKATAGKDGNVAAKLMANIEKPEKEYVKVNKKATDKYLDDDSDEDEDDDDSDENEDIIDSSADNSEEEWDDSSDEETTPEMAIIDNKRKFDSASKFPIREKKAKVVTPVENNKIGGDGKKTHVHVATPHPAKQGGKPQQSSKYSGSETFKYHNRTSNSENAFQAHKKSKHVAGAK